VNLIGGSGSVAYYGSPRLAAVADYSQTYKNNLPGPSFQGGGPVSLRESTYLFGPRVSFPKAGSKLTPYAQALLGLTHDTGSAAQTSLFSGYGGTQDYTHSTISFGVGGGLDYKVKKHITFRVVQLEYVLNTLPTTAGNTKENNIRVDTGLVVRF
jgi:opacity protein-like surface antigen